MKNLFIATAPNIQSDDLKLIFKLLLQPWKWKNSVYVDEFEKKMEEYIGGNSKAVVFDSARSSFYLLLKEYKIGKGDEVIMPSFTCVVIVNSVLHAGAKPVYVDTNPETFNIDLDDLKRKVTKNTKAILVQHTFGVMVDVQRVREIVGPKVKIVEDMAHILSSDLDSARSDNSSFSKRAVRGDACILTFGIEKMMTTLRGGMLVVKDEQMYMRLKVLQRSFPKFSHFRIFKWLINPLLWSILEPVYYLGFGKFSVGRAVSFLGHKLGLMGNMMEGCEYGGCWPKWMPSQMPGVLAIVGMNQLSKLDKMNEHRREIAKIYDENLGKSYSKYEGYTPLRYPVLVKEPKKVHAFFKTKHIILGNWYEKYLFTNPRYLDELYFDPSILPGTSHITKHVINLPTNIKVDKKDALMIAHGVKDFLI